MKEIRCPKCNSVFTVDEADYASIVNQVKNAEFESEIQRRIEELHKQHEAEQEAASLKADKDFQSRLNAKEVELATKEAEIQRLQSQIGGIDQVKKLELEAECTKRDKQIAELQAQLEQYGQKVKIAVMEERDKAKDSMREKEDSIVELKNKIELLQKESTIRETNVKEDYERQLKQKQELIDYYKDLKAKLSTKMIGESLEVHCSNEFNKVRASIFPVAYF